MISMIMVMRLVYGYGHGYTRDAGWSEFTSRLLRPDPGRSGPNPYFAFTCSFIHSVNYVCIYLLIDSLIGLMIELFFRYA